jgi:hypothetical protein
MILFLLIASTCFAAINDPGAGLGTRAERRTARVTQWQAQYAGLTAEQIQDQARRAVYDYVDADCTRRWALQRLGTPADPQTALTAGQESTADEYVEGRIGLLASTEKLDVLDARCPGGATFTPENQEQGGLTHKTLVIRGAAVSDGIRSMLPVLPRVGSVPPLSWGTMASTTECTVGGITGPCYASRHRIHEAHWDLLEAIVSAEGRLGNFARVDDLADVGWTYPE